MKRTRSLAAAFAISLGVAGAQAPTFSTDNYSAIGLGPFVVTALSPDGTNAYGTGSGGSTPLYWPAPSNVIALPGTVQAINGAGGSSVYVGFGSSGGKIVAVSGNTVSGTSAVLPNGVTVNGSGGSVFSNSGSANGASPNGLVVVGRVRYIGSNSGPSRAAFWSGGSVGPFGPNGTSATVATDSTYPFRIGGVTNSTTEFEGATPFISDGTRVGTTDLGQPFGFDAVTSVRAISDDGTQLIGYSGNAANTYRRAFLFDTTAHLWHQPAEDFDALSSSYRYAYGASGDAKAVIGTYGAPNATPHAFVWFPGVGSWDLQSLLTTQAGVDFKGFTLTGAAAISRDGKVITGTCLDPSGVVAYSYVIRSPKALRGYAPSAMITSISPSFFYSYASPGTSVDLYGSNFTPQSVVNFDGVACATTYDWSGHLLFGLPTNLYGHVAKVVVSDPLFGNSAPFDLSILDSDPYLTKTNPTVITAGSNDTLVTVYGQYLIENAAVVINGDLSHKRATKFLGSQAVQFVLTKDDLKNPGQLWVGVNIPGYGTLNGSQSISVVPASPRFQLTLQNVGIIGGNGRLMFSLANTGNLAVTGIRNVKIVLSGGFSGSTQGLPFSSLAVGASGVDVVSFGVIPSGTKVLVSVSGKADQGSFTLSRVVTVF